MSGCVRYWTQYTQKKNVFRELDTFSSISKVLDLVTFKCVLPKSENCPNASHTAIRTTRPTSLDYHTRRFFFKQRRIWLYLLRLYRLIAQLFFVRKSLLLIQSATYSSSNLCLCLVLLYRRKQTNLFSNIVQRRIGSWHSRKDDKKIFYQLSFLLLCLYSTIFGGVFPLFLDRMRSLFPNLGHLPFFRRDYLYRMSISSVYSSFCVSKAQRSFRCFLSC